MTPPPPPASPSAEPSPPPPASTPWAACGEEALRGDYNRVNGASQPACAVSARLDHRPPRAPRPDCTGFTLGDAIYVATRWAENRPLCVEDINGLNGFTLGDAIHVAQVWAGTSCFLWQSC